MQPFTVDIDERDGWLVVQLRGHASADSTAPLFKHLSPALDQKPDRIIIELADLAFINSMGLGALLEFRRHVQAYGGRMRLAGASDRIAEVFRKTRLAELFPMYASADAAVRDADGGA